MTTGVLYTLASTPLSRFLELNSIEIRIEADSDGTSGKSADIDFELAFAELFCSLRHAGNIESQDCWILPPIFRVIGRAAATLDHEIAATKPKIDQG